MKTIFALLAITFSVVISAQTENVWIGGAIGYESDWNFGRNWSEGVVPDMDTYVIINFTNSGHNSQPIITGVAEAASIEVGVRGKLVIAESAELVIDGADVYSEGVALYGGQLINEGVLYIQNVESDSSVLDLSKYSGSGLVVIDAETNEGFMDTTMASNAR